MAHANIDERRNSVKNIIDIYGNVNIDIQKELSKKFGCTRTAIKNDIATILSGENKTIFVYKELKKEVLKRDNNTCQYCGRNDLYLIAEHVIPFILGGHAENYNIVASCTKCNLKKRTNVWTPANITTLEKINFEWAQKIKSLSTEH